jgi:hypothetical protein
MSKVSGRTVFLSQILITHARAIRTDEPVFRPVDFPTAEDGDQSRPRRQGVQERHPVDRRRAQGDQVHGDRPRQGHADRDRRRRPGAHRAEAEEGVLRRDHPQRGGRQAQGGEEERPLRGGVREALQGEVRQAGRLLQGVQGRVRDGMQGVARDEGELLLRRLLHGEPLRHLQPLRRAKLPLLLLRRRRRQQLALRRRRWLLLRGDVGTVQYPVGLVDYPAIQNLISACLFLLFQYALVVPQQFLILKSVRDCTNNYFPLVIDHEGGSLLFIPKGSTQAGTEQKNVTKEDEKHQQSATTMNCPKYHSVPVHTNLLSKTQNTDKKSD